MTAETDFSFSAGLSASIGDLTAQLRAQRQQQAKAASECWYVQPPAIIIPAGATFTYAPQNWGPNTGYCWAIQRLTFATSGDESDNVTIYRGHTVNDISPMNALNTLAQPSGFPAVVTWHPGRVGLVLMPDESLVFSGAIAAGNGVITADVIQVTSANLPALLL
jgi:hypothetical protein